MHPFVKLTFVAAAVALAAAPAHAQPKKADAPKAADKKGDKNDKKPVVEIKTSAGSIKVELDAEKAPISVKNFLEYVDAKQYDGTIFHRVIANFMIQGGGFDKNMVEKPTKAPIKNEASNGLKNLTGTIAMARTSVPDSATAQFYINVKDNGFLDHRDMSDRGIGYAVFGKVTEGMDVVKKIETTPTGTAKNGMPDVPTTPVVIESIRRVK